ncbi:MAG: type II secretion system protein [Bacilli bacterium]|nr:type II secretion system protein [Bacilli bacterium]
MNNKGYTLIELLGTIAIIGILTYLAVAGVSKYVDKSKKETYANHEKTLKRATQNYMMDHLDSTGRIAASTLKDEGYLDNLEDPKSHTSCIPNTFVDVQASQAPNSFNTSYTYTICLKCANYESETCPSS